MTESVILSEPDHGGSFAEGSKARRGWTLFVACAGVAMVVASMVALNTALGDIAVATGATQTQLTWIVDSYTLLLACLRCPRERSETAKAAGPRCCGRSSRSSRGSP